MRLHKVLQRLCAVIFPHILQLVTADAVVVQWWPHEYISSCFCATTFRLSFVPPLHQILATPLLSDDQKTATGRLHSDGKQRVEDQL